jgi:hypothetical protein
MGENQNQKVDELLQKLKSLGDRAKSTRSQLGSPLVDRLFDRVDKLSSRLPQNGDSRPQQPPQEPTLACPKCGVLALSGSHFCSKCGFDFEEEQRQQAKAAFEREKIERAGRVGVLF